MNRWKKPKKNICHCSNCGYDIMITPDTVKEKTFGKHMPVVDKEMPIIATYIECPVCGELLLKQLDTERTSKMAQHGVKLEMLQRQGKKLNNKQKARLKKIEKDLFNTRKSLNLLYWDEIYQLLNQYEDAKTEMADQEPTLGNEVTSTEQAGERMAEHV